MVTYRRRGTAITVGRPRRVLIVPLCEINLPPFRPFNKLSKDVSHIQIVAAVSKHSALVRSALKSL